MHPAVVKAQAWGAIFQEHGWKGKIESEVEMPFRTTTLDAVRDDEEITMQWQNKRLNSVVYQIANSEPINLMTKEQVTLAISTPNRTDYTIAKEDSYIIELLRDCRIFWWDAIDAVVRSDIVLKRQPKWCKVSPVGHRKMLQFNGLQAGQRNVFVDAIIKVI